ncbi:hypothetical protein EWI61_08975 [Methylolobus aquaticus]|nr:hypothetical protein EWI61_08975 [Methylolobus aquaticus]
MNIDTQKLYRFRNRHAALSTAVEAAEARLADLRKDQVFIQESISRCRMRIEPEGSRQRLEPYSDFLKDLYRDPRNFIKEVRRRGLVSIGDLVTQLERVLDQTAMAETNLEVAKARLSEMAWFHRVDRHARRLGV